MVVMMKRPDLSAVQPEIRRYIEYLEAQLPNIALHAEATDLAVEKPVFSEPETTQCIFTLTRSGLCKRTYRHLYSRQHRGGMGVFDIEVSGDDEPVYLSAFDERQVVLIFTNFARVFRFNPRNIEPTPVRSKGVDAFSRLGLEQGERVVAILPEQAQGYVALVSEVGKVKLLRHHLFGEHMRQGINVFAVQEFGLLAAACWTPGHADLFIATKAGMAIRFPEKTVPPTGSLGIRITEQDQVVSITPVQDDTNVFLLGSDGKGTLRMMSGFAANKSPGGMGKIAIRNSQVIGASGVDLDRDIFIITRAAKIIRVNASEIPPTEGVVQGVSCVALRQDSAVAFVMS